MLLFESGRLNQIECSGLTPFRTRKVISCTLTKDENDFDIVTFTDPFLEAINEEDYVQLKFGFIRNPISGDLKSGFELMAFSHKQGKICEASTYLQVHEFSDTLNNSIEVENSTIGRKTDVLL